MVAWPTGLPYRPLRDSLVHKMPEARGKTENEAGPSRIRRRSTVTIQHVEQSLELTRPQYEAWRAWHGYEIGQGADWFDMPIYTGASYAHCPVRLIGTPKARPSGLRWRLPLRLEVYDMPVVDLEPEDLSPAWLEDLPYQPVPESIEPIPHEELLRSEGEAGAIAVRRRFVNTPAKQKQAWDLTLPQYERWRAWWRLALLDGVRWFTLPVWSGDRYRSCQARFLEPPEARLRGGVYWRVAGSLELKVLATLSRGEMQGYLAASQLHHLVHTVLPASLPAGS